jgi:hypothetical protein
MERAIGRVEGNIDGLGKSLDTLRTQTMSGFKDIKKDIHSLSKIDRRQNGQISGLKGNHRWILGGIAVIAFLALLFVSIYF